ncbi:MAG: hypothetical protein JXB03_00845 [Spirochaetales bacterium]|nr:hypothetical protein [Spirochaetales bacterium]
MIKMSTSFTFMILIALLILSFVSCEMEAEDDSTIILQSSSSLDGQVNRIGVVVTNEAEIAIGRDANGIGTRGFFSFDFSEVNADGNIIIDSAHFEVYESDFSNNPFETMGSVLLDIVDYGPSLNPNDFYATLLADCGVFASGSNYLDTHSSDITQELRAFFETNPAATLVQFRLMFENDKNTTDPLLQFRHWFVSSVDDGDAHRPRLVLDVSYE